MCFSTFVMSGRKTCRRDECRQEYRCTNSQTVDQVPTNIVLQYATESTESARVFGSRQCSDAHNTFQRQSGPVPRIFPKASASLAGFVTAGLKRSASFTRHAEVWMLDRQVK